MKAIGSGVREVRIRESLLGVPCNLKARSALLYEIRKVVKGWGLAQDQAARRLGLTRPRLNDLLQGKLAKFSLDALVNIATSAHLSIEISVRGAA